MFKPQTPAGGGGFAADPRFAAKPGLGPALPTPPGDPLDQARREGYLAGHAEGLAEARERAAEDNAAHQALAATFASLGEAQTALLADRLRETVQVLCETLIADIALDPQALVRRAEAAAALLVRADDERSFRLNPEDLKLVGGRLPADWAIDPDPGLERGAIRIETAAGGVEDGPDNWRRAVIEALRAC